jgi:hypothetical protein
MLKKCKYRNHYLNMLVTHCDNARETGVWRIYLHGLTNIRAKMSSKHPLLGHYHLSRIQYYKL